MQRQGSLQTEISACESCVSSGAWRHAPQKKKMILSILKSFKIVFIGEKTFSVYIIVTSEMQFLNENTRFINHLYILSLFH